MLAPYFLWIIILAKTSAVDDYKRYQLLSYYSCLSKRESGTISNRKFSPVPIVAVDGSIAVLPCVECMNPVKPLDHWVGKNYTWFYQLWKPEALYEKVPVSDEQNIVSGFFVDKRYHALIAVGIKDNYFSGEYFCVDKNGLILGSYHLDVVPNDPMKTLLPNDDETETANVPLDDGVEVFTEWSAWSACNQCGAIAEKRRYGKCFIKRRKDDDAATTDSIAELLRRYPAGVPCRFSWIPMEVQDVDEVFNRPNYLQIKLCKFYCVTQPPIRLITEKIKGGKGYRIIEKVKRNRYSMREPLPELPPPIIRVLRDTVASDGLALYCPKFDGETFWQKGDTRESRITLTSTMLSKATGDRIYVDENSNLIFDYLEAEDQGMYSCWDSNGDLLMTATVNVAEPAKDALIKTALILTGILIVCAAGFYIIWSSFKMKRA